MDVWSIMFGTLIPFIIIIKGDSNHGECQRVRVNMLCFSHISHHAGCLIFFQFDKEGLMVGQWAFQSFPKFVCYKMFFVNHSICIGFFLWFQNKDIIADLSTFFFRNYLTNWWTRTCTEIVLAVLKDRENKAKWEIDLSVSPHRCIGSSFTVSWTVLAIGGNWNL